jgi:hypothetical protein
LKGETLVEYLNAQHCLTIAAAFIAIVAACASLISVANGKSDSIANRYRELTKEYREGAANERRNRYEDARLVQLKLQIELYKLRVEKVVGAQCFLFRTVFIFVSSIAIFLMLALLIVVFRLPDEQVNDYTRIPLGLIGVCVIVGAVFMFKAIRRLYSEVKMAQQTFEIETNDCLLSKAGRAAEEFQVA